MNPPRSLTRAVVALALGILAGACGEESVGIINDGPMGPIPGTIRGRVVDAATGEPVVGAFVGTTPATRTASSDAEGRFVIDGIPLTTSPLFFSVTAVKSGYRSDSVEVQLSATRGASAVADLSLDPLPVPVPIGGTLAARVFREDGTVVSGATVTVLLPSGEPVAEGPSDAQGFALFPDLGPGSWTVRARVTIAGRPFEGFAGATTRASEDDVVHVVVRRVF